MFEKGKREAAGIRRQKGGILPAPCVPEDRAAGSPVRAWQGRVLPLGLAHGEHERMQRRRESVERGAS